MVQYLSYFYISNPTIVKMRLKYDYSVISVIVNSLPGNTKNRESTSSWLIGVRLFQNEGGVDRQAADPARRGQDTPERCE